MICPLDRMPCTTRGGCRWPCVSVARRNRTMDRAMSTARRNQVDPPMHEQVKVAIFIAMGIIVAALALLSAIAEVVVGMS